MKDEYYIEKVEFVEKLSEVLNMAKPHLTCEYKLGEEIGKYEDEEYVVVTCENGYQYIINVTCDSLIAIGLDVFRAMFAK